MRFEFNKRRGFLQEVDGPDRNIIDFSNATLEGFDLVSRPPVASLAALASVDDSEEPSAAVRFVETIKCSFILDKSSTADVTATTSIATNSGTGRWLRLPGQHPSWLTQSDWYINSTTGNDENVGDQASRALKTDAERQRRLGFRAPIRPAYVSAQFTRPWRLRIIGTLPVDDPVVLSLAPTQDVTVHVMGSGSIVDYSGSITAITAKNPATNTPFSFTDSALPTVNGWSNHIAKRGRIVGGPRDGAIFWFDKDLGNRTVRISDPSRVRQIGATDPFFAFTLTPLTPVVGDAYVVESLPQITTFTPDVHFAGNGDWNANYQSFLMFGELSINTRNEFDLFALNGDYNNITYSCRMGGVVSTARWYYSLNDCQGNNGLGRGGALTAASGRTVKSGGLVSAGTSANSNVYGLPGAILIINYDAQISKGQISAHKVHINSVSIWDTPSNVSCPGGHALYVGGEWLGSPHPGATAVLGGFTGGFHTATAVRLWGSGSVGAGVFVSPGSTFAYATATPPTISGSGGHFSLADVSTGRPWNEANSSYGTARATTWSNMTGTIALGGFAGNAHNVALNAHVIAQ